jgi:uncharacterized membrane protein (GlpM family)
MPDEQAWQTAFYYGLSTVAQTLAAAFGILSTFMLFRFQHAETKIERHGEDISQTITTLGTTAASAGDLVDQLREAHPAAVDEVVGDVVRDAGGRPASARHEGVRQLRAAGAGISFWSAFHRRAMRRLRQALLLTVSTIGFCLVQLPLLPLLTRRMPLAAALVGTAVVLALICLILYARLILLLLVPEDEPPPVAATPR